VLKEFKEFAIKGNVVDMAVGIIIGAAFTTVVKSLVDDLIMPPMGAATGGLDFSDKYAVLVEGDPAGPYGTLVAAREAGATVLAWGNFVNSVVAFLLVSIVLFLIVRWVNRLRRPDTEPAPTTKSCTYCMSNIHKDATRCPECTSELTTAAS
jgi:large conductance mechanosensitive channel